MGGARKSNNMDPTGWLVLLITCPPHTLSITPTLTHTRTRIIASPVGAPKS